MDSSIHFQVTFTSKQKFNGIDVPTTPFSIPSTTSLAELNSLLNKILAETYEQWSDVEFDFLIGDELLRGSLEETVTARSLATESVIEIECIVREPAPTPELNLPHDDWVSAVAAFDQHFVSACYDNSVYVWTLEGENKCVASGHAAPVKTVAALEAQGSNSDMTFVSGSQDQTLMLWQYSTEKNTAQCSAVFRGHARSVECVCFSPDGSRIASGGFDNMLKIWSTAEGDDAPAAGLKTKKHKKNSDTTSPFTKVPIVTLAGHREAVSGVCWTDKAEVMTCSWDHSIVLWDLELAGQKAVLPGRTVFTSISYSNLNQLLLASSCDKFVRMWDPRAKDATVVKAKYSSHTGWVSAVQWSPSKPNSFVSASYDNTSKIWDVRNTKAPLFDLTGHEDKVLCVNWNNPAYILSGSADETVKIFKTLSS